MVARRTVLVLLAVVVSGCPLAAKTPPAAGKPAPCPVGMAYVAVERAAPYCIDRWEASVVELRGRYEVAHPPTAPVTSLVVKAVSRPGVVPQGYISKVEAEDACRAAKKRLCTSAEWELACRGRTKSTFPYGDARRSGFCNDAGRAPFAALFPGLGEGVYASARAMNDPRINQAPNTVARTGAFSKCTSTFGVHDMVGNLHEWVADVSPGGTRGTFRGGYFQDTHLNGDGCAYRTVAHDISYHDYSTGFRCCADPR